MVLENQSMVLTYGFPRLMDHYSHTCVRGWVAYDMFEVIITHFSCERPSSSTYMIIFIYLGFLEALMDPSWTSLKCDLNYLASTHHPHEHWFEFLEHIFWDLHSFSLTHV